MQETYTSDNFGGYINSMFELDLHRLAVFYTVVNEGTLSKAGDSLYMSQPAISAHIKALEQQLGVPLFYRVGRRSVVNKAGEVLYKKAEQLFSVADELKAEMDELKGMSIGRLNLGASVDWQYRLPNDLDKFKQKFPRVELSMNLFTEERIERLVLDRTLDMGFVGHVPTRPELASEHLGDDDLVPICSRTHKLFKKARVKPSDLQGESIIVREADSAARHVSDQVLESHELTDGVSMELGSYEAIKAAVMVGKGIGLVAHQSLGAEIQADLVKVLDIPEMAASIQLHLIYMKDKKMTTSQSAFLEIVAPNAVTETAVEA